MDGDGNHESHAPEVVTTFGVLREEYRRIWPGKPEPSDLPDYYRLAFENSQAALCLSGGGIRSASFALGVIQALSRKRLLVGFHYLSTVSGGGYIGGWLQRWIHEARGEVATVERALRHATREPDSDAGIEGEVEPEEIRALRENSNFITPRVGIGSNDTWTAVATSLRNIAVNWLLFAPLLLLATMVPNIFYDWVEWIGGRADSSRAIQIVALLLSLVFVWRAAWFTCHGLPSYRGDSPPGAGDGWLMRKIVLWLVVWSLLGTIVLWIDLQPASKKVAETVSRFAAQWLPGERTSALLGYPGVAFALISFVTALIALVAAGSRLPASPDPSKDYRGAFRKDFRLWAGSLFFATVTIPLGCLLFRQLSDGIADAWVLRVFVVVAPLWLMWSQMMIAFNFAALRRARTSCVNSDADREWLARLSAVKIRPMLLWGVLAASTLLIVQWLGIFDSAGNFSLTGATAAITGIVAVFGGRGRNTGNVTQGISTTILRYIPLGTVISIATFLFLVVLLVIFGAAEQALARNFGAFFEPPLSSLDKLLRECCHRTLPPGLIKSPIAAHIVIALALAWLLWVFNKRIPVNRFSLNGFYRNRLGRAFLGGARLAELRKPDRFTGFDPKDNVNLQDLNPHVVREGKAPTETTSRAVLYPVVNVALNVTATQNLAWQERKAEPFILSPLYCGSGMLVPEGTLTANLAASMSPNEEDRPGVYVCSRGYGGSEPDRIDRTAGISLATAMSISGAAASPNMGYHSSAATAFLMTLFNVRLGAWLPNPARRATLGDEIYLSNPASSLRALLRELAGSTDDQGLDIYLSDGGHFENLALYEMVRRRCRFILVSDAGADPNCDFDDLGNAIRKVKIDFGVDIVFAKIRISSRTKQIEGQAAWAQGKVHYPEGTVGDILYIKPSFFDRPLPIDVVSYAKGSATFPHESTGDQFFSESQFESYRKLGFTLTDEIARRVDGGVDYPGIAEFFDALDDDDTAAEEADKRLKERFLRWLRGLTG